MTDDPRRLTAQQLAHIREQITPGPIDFIVNWSDHVVRRLMSHIDLLEREAETARVKCATCGHGLDGCEDGCECRCCNDVEVCEDYDLCKCPVCAQGWEEIARESMSGF